MMIRYLFLLCLLSNSMPGMDAQSVEDIKAKALTGKADLNSCISYALDNNPLMGQLRIRERIIRRTIASELSDWLPQVDLNANYQNFLLQPVSIFPDFNNPNGPKREVTTGVIHTSAIQIGASQTLYSPEVVSAMTSARFFKRQISQANQEQTIELVVNVSKAFYNVLLTEATLDVFLEDRARIERSYQDAFSLYESGLNDKTDYQRAQIALNNIDAEIAGTREQIKASYAFLKELMGYPVSHPISIKSDSNIADKAWLDTAVSVQASDRIEYQLLLTNMMIQHATVNLQKMQFLPTLSAFANYNLIYQNDDFEALYNRDFPNSAAGLRLAFPLFQGGRRLNQLKIARLRLNELRFDSVGLKSRINTEFENAMASYKTYLKALEAATENAQLADGIYNITRLQYNQGIKSFLEVIVSEADLRTARLNELNALYRLITSKLDVDASLGRIQTNY